MSYIKAVSPWFMLNKKLRGAAEHSIVNFLAVSLRYKSTYWHISQIIRSSQITPNMNYDDIIREIKNKIETKAINYPEEKIIFKKNLWLVPGIWLDKCTSRMEK